MPHKGGSASESSPPNPMAGWCTSKARSARTFFVGRSIALALAKLFAQALAPSRVRLVDLSGRVTEEWAYAPRMMRY